MLYSCDRNQSHVYHFRLGSVLKWTRYIGSRFLLVLGCCFLLPTHMVQGQIVPDGTLGPEGSVVMPDFLLEGLDVDLIEGGAFRENVIFHSFSEFNVADGQRVYFADPLNIDHIVTRVTGSTVSNIFGTLGVAGTANFYFTNPNGLVFGPNAELDMRSAFFASTADRFVFADGATFSASNPQALPLLSLALSPGLQYGEMGAGGVGVEDLSAGAIITTGALQVGEDLILAAHQLDLQGRIQSGGNLTLYGENAVTIQDSAETPFIGTANGNLWIQGNELIDIFALNHPESGLFAGGDLVLRSRNPISGDAHFLSHGNFQVQQPDGRDGDLMSLNDPIIRSSGNVQFDAYTGTSLHIFAGGSVTIGGTVAIIAPDMINGLPVESVVLSNGNSLTVDGQSRPTLDIRAGTTAVGSLGNTPAMPVGFTPPIPSTDLVTTDANIRVGTITVRDTPGGLVFLTNQYQPNRALEGNIQVNRLDTSSNVGGDVVLDSRDGITVRDGIDASSVDLPEIAEPIADAGNILLLANNAVVLDGARVVSKTTGAGAGGDVEIAAGSLFLTNSAELNVGTSGTGNGGSLRIVVDDTASFDGSSAISSVEGRVGGRVAPTTAGNIEISAGTVQVANDSTIRASSAGNGDAGSVVINANERINVIGNESTLLAQASALGGAGSVVINTGELLVVNGAISVGLIDDAGEEIEGGDRDAVGDRVTTGNLDIVARRVTLDDTAQLISNTTAGNAGNITLNLDELLVLRRASLISTTAGREMAGGNGGNITIIVPNGFIVGLTEEDTDIAANAFTGDGGRVDITAVAIYGLDFQEMDTALSDITASSEFGFDGEVILNTLDIDPLQGSEELPGGFAGPGLDRGCQVGGNRRSGSLRIIGRGGVPISPNQVFEYEAFEDDFSGSNRTDLADNAPVERLQPLPMPNNHRPAQDERVEHRWVEAQDLVIENGQASLISNTRSLTSSRRNTLNAAAGCYQLQSFNGNTVLGEQ